MTTKARRVLFVIDRVTEICVLTNRDAAAKYVSLSLNVTQAAASSFF